MTEHQWQPIETAPKVRDQTLILATFVHGDALEIFTGIWDVEDGAGGWLSHQHCDIMEPTHWMPLNPPKS